MNIFGKLTATMLLLSGLAFAGCSPVEDNANVLGSQHTDTLLALNRLNDAGADAKVVTMTNLGGFPNIDALMMQLVNMCPGWQSPNHGPKSNLIIMAAVPSMRKSGIFLGAITGDAFSNGRSSRYRTDFMNAKFKTGDWAGGFIAAANQMTSRLQAYTSEANTPVTNTVVNEAAKPSDYTGLWHFLEWSFGLGFIAFLVGLYFYGKKVAKENESKRREAQLHAMEAKNTASMRLGNLVTLMNAFSGKLSDNPSAAAASTIVDSATASIQSLSQSINNDPSDESLSVAQYNSIANLYNSIGADLASANRYMQDPTRDPYEHRSYSPTPAPAPEQTEIPESEPTQHSSPQPQPQTVHHYHEHTTVIHDNNNNDLATGILIGEEMNRPSYQEPEPEPERKSSFSDDSSSGSFISDDSFSSFSDNSSSGDF